MNYVEEFRNSIVSENDISNKQEDIDHLSRNSYPTHIHPNSQKTFEL